MLGVGADMECQREAEEYHQEDDRPSDSRRQPCQCTMGFQAEYPEDLRPGGDRHERPEQAGRLEERHGHRREPELHVRSRLLDSVGPIERVDDDQEQVRCTPERDHRAQREQSQGRFTLDARDLVPDQDVGLVREERPQGRFELVDRHVSEAGRPAACAREVGQSQDHADQDDGQERDGGEHRVESNSRRPGHGIVFFHPLPHPHGDCRRDRPPRLMIVRGRKPLGMSGSYGIDVRSRRLQVHCLIEILGGRCTNGRPP